jgi:hypothetical protein
LPAYDAEDTSSKKFVKVMSIGDKIGGLSENFVLYSDGTLVTNNIKLVGSIQWTDASSPSKNVYIRAVSPLNKPADNTKFNTFPETSETAWHTKYDPDTDVYYSHTDNGGATWQEPMLITGRSIVDSTIEYTIDNLGLNQEEISAI